MGRNTAVASLRRGFLVAAALAAFVSQGRAEEYYYGIEINGVLCGYARLVTSPLRQDGREVTVLRHEIVLKGSLLGAPVDNRMALTYHLDPATKRFSYHDSTIEQGPARLTSAIRVEGRSAHVSGQPGGAETIVELPEGVVLANTLFHPHLVADFARGAEEKKTYLIFDGRDNAVRGTTYTRAGSEKVQRAGRAFDTIVLDSVDHRTGVNGRLWLDSQTGIPVQTRLPGGRLTYLATPEVVQEIRFASFDSVALTKTNASIRDIRSITFMRVQVSAAPSGLRVTPESLTLPGQRFAGSVKDNLVEGVFEIEHPRYDGANAPPFPPDFFRDATLRDALTPGELIQSDDPVLGDKAREITKGSRDSWEAARRLSAWVAGNIRGAIPGGVTARGTFDERAGDCGGHSFLLAALCRSVGIPARVVWGCMYVPHGGGAFGQHAWNEVYMGEAGWVPVDSTVKEVDFVDSGHIRFGPYQSVATALNATRFEVLEHRESGSSPRAAPASSTATKFEPFVGEYKNVERGNLVQVLDKGGVLTLDIPGKMVLGLKAPDADGVWRSTVSDQLYVTFERRDSGQAAAMLLHQVVRMGRSPAPEAAAEVVPAELQPFPGTYLLAQAGAEFKVAYENQALVIHDPLAKRTVRLKPSGSPDSWVDEFGKFTIRFEKDGAGTVTAMLLDGATVFRR
jgi:transglutaminase-like putative cysteine protease